MCEKQYNERRHDLSGTKNFTTLKECGIMYKINIARCLDRPKDKNAVFRKDTFCN